MFKNLSPMGSVISFILLKKKLFLLGVWVFSERMLEQKYTFYIFDYIYSTGIAPKIIYN